MSEQRTRIQKQSGEPTEFEYHVAQTLGEIEASVSELKAEMKEICITGATEFKAVLRGGSTAAVVIMLTYRSMSAIKKVHSQLVSELQRRFSRPVVLVFKRTILPKYLKSKGQQKRPYSRTLTMVHEAVLEDIIYPVNIVGKRMRVKSNGKRVFKVLLNPGQRELVEDKLELLSAVYKQLTTKEVVFEFPVSKEFPV